MKHHIKIIALNKFFHFRTIANIHGNEGCSARNAVSEAGGEIVHNSDRMSHAQQFSAADRANIAGTARHQHIRHQCDASSPGGFGSVFAAEHDPSRHVPKLSSPLESFTSVTGI